MHRLFVAIRPPEEVRDLLIDAMDDSPALRWVGDEQLHLTLRFIGEVERPAGQRHRCRASRSALARVSNCVCPASANSSGGAEAPFGPAWSRRSRLPRWPQRSSAPFNRSGWSRSTGHFRRTSRWHDGTAATRKRSTPSSGGTANLRSEPFPVDRFILFESHLSRHGPHYEEVAAFPLR